MSNTLGFELHLILLSVKFVQGYRFLDRCGETLVQLEKKLAKGWIPTETTPSTGAMRNDGLGMVIAFNSDNLTIRQHEFLDFAEFRDQACRAYEIVHRTIEVDRINVPTLRVQYQKGFEDDQVQQAENFLMDLELCTPDSHLLAAMTGKPSSLGFTILTLGSSRFVDAKVEHRRRLEASVIKQERQPSFDSRILQRASQWAKGQQEALRAMLRLRKLQRGVAPVAVQFDIEDSLEEEFSTSDFPMYDFIDESWKWVESVKQTLVASRRA